MLNEVLPFLYPQLTDDQFQWAALSFSMMGDKEKRMISTFPTLACVVWRNSQIQGTMAQNI